MVFEVVPRIEWGAAPPRSPPTRVNFPILRVVFTYHTGALSCSNREQCSKELRSIQANHFKRGMTDIAYNFLVGGQGEAYEGRGWGVLPSSQLKLRFGDRVDIAFIGNFTQDTLPGKVFRSSLQLISLGTKLGHITQKWEIEHIQKTYYQKKKPLSKANVPHYKKKVEVIDPLSDDSDDVVGEGKMRSKRKFEMDEDELDSEQHEFTDKDFSYFDKEADRMANERKRERGFPGISENSIANDRNQKYDSDDVNTDDDEEEFKFDDEDDGDMVFQQSGPEGPGRILSNSQLKSKFNLNRRKLRGDEDHDNDSDDEFKINERDFKFDKSATSGAKGQSTIQSTPNKQRQQDILNCLDKFGFDEEASKFGKTYGIQFNKSNNAGTDSSLIRNNKLKSNPPKQKLDDDGFKFNGDFKSGKQSVKLSKRQGKPDKLRPTSGKSDFKFDGYFDSSEDAFEFDKNIAKPRRKVGPKQVRFDPSDDLESDESAVKVKGNNNDLKLGKVSTRGDDRAALLKHKRKSKANKTSLKFLSDQLKSFDDQFIVDRQDFKLKKDRSGIDRSIDEKNIDELIEDYGKSGREKNKNIERRTSKILENNELKQPKKDDLKLGKSYTAGEDGEKSESEKTFNFDNEEFRDVESFDEREFKMDTMFTYKGNELEFDVDKLMKDPDLCWDEHKLHADDDDVKS